MAAYKTQGTYIGHTPVWGFADLLHDAVVDALNYLSGRLKWYLGYCFAMSATYILSWVNWGLDKCLALVPDQFAAWLTEGWTPIRQYYAYANYYFPVREAFVMAVAVQGFRFFWMALRKALGWLDGWL